MLRVVRLYNPPLSESTFSRIHVVALPQTINFKRLFVAPHEFQKYSNAFTNRLFCVSIHGNSSRKYDNGFVAAYGFQIFAQLRKSVKPILCYRPLISRIIRQLAVELTKLFFFRTLIDSGGIETECIIKIITHKKGFANTATTVNCNQLRRFGFNSLAQYLLLYFSTYDSISHNKKLGYLPQRYTKKCDSCR